VEASIMFQFFDILYAFSFYEGLAIWGAEGFVLCH